MQNIYYAFIAIFHISIMKDTNFYILSVLAKVIFFLMRGNYLAAFLINNFLDSHCHMLIIKGKLEIIITYYDFLPRDIITYYNFLLFI